MFRNLSVIVGNNYLKLSQKLLKPTSSCRYFSSDHQPISFSLLNKQDENNVSNAKSFGELAKKHGKVFVPPDDCELDDIFEKTDPILDALNEEGTNEAHNDPKWYHKQCKKLELEGKIYECVQMLTHKMLKVDRVAPKHYNFTVVITALGKVGHAKKAFEVYEQSLSYNIKTELPTYTSLFNAVANSPNKEHILFAEKLYNKISKDKHLLNSMVYNSIIKAFAVHGESYVDSFAIFQDMLKAGKVPDEMTFMALLNACSKDPEKGFLNAIQVFI